MADSRGTLRISDEPVESSTIPTAETWQEWSKRVARERIAAEVMARDNAAMMSKQPPLRFSDEPMEVSIITVQPPRAAMPEESWQERTKRVAAERIAMDLLAQEAALNAAKPGSK